MVAQQEQRVNCLDVKYELRELVGQLGVDETLSDYSEAYLRGDKNDSVVPPPPLADDEWRRANPGKSVEDRRRVRCRSFVDFRNNFELLRVEYPSSGHFSETVIGSDHRERSLHGSMSGGDRSAVVRVDVDESSHRSFVPLWERPHLFMYWVGRNRRPLSDVLKSADEISVGSRLVSGSEVFVISIPGTSMYGSGETTVEAAKNGRLVLGDCEVILSKGQDVLPLRSYFYEYTWDPNSPFFQKTVAQVGPDGREVSAAEAKAELVKIITERGGNPSYFVIKGYRATAVPRFRYLSHVRACTDIRVVTPGIRMPFLMVRLSRNLRDSHVVIRELRVLHASFNEDPQNLHATWRFPVGTHVSDNIIGQGYRQGFSPASYPEEASKQVEQVRMAQRGEVKLPAVPEEPGAMARRDETKGIAHRDIASWVWPCAFVAGGLAIGLVALGICRRRLTAKRVL